jgi:predicted  nucleic acid-binding Zn-ribbon protein
MDEQNGSENIPEIPEWILKSIQDMWTAAFNEAYNKLKNETKDINNAIYRLRNENARLYKEYQKLKEELEGEKKKYKHVEEKLKEDID